MLPFTYIIQWSEERSFPDYPKIFCPKLETSFWYDVMFIEWNATTLWYLIFIFFCYILMGIHRENLISISVFVENDFFNLLNWLQHMFENLDINLFKRTCDEKGFISKIFTDVWFFWNTIKCHVTKYLQIWHDGKYLWTNIFSV